MFFKKRKVDLTAMPLEKVRLSSEDLFTLMGGMDTCMVACNPKTIDFALVAAQNPQRDAWRRNVVNRYQGFGLVDAGGNPNEELGRALAALSAAGVAVFDGKVGDSTSGVVVSEQGACGIVKAPGFGGGFFLRPFPEDRVAWPAAFRQVFAEKDYPFSAAPSSLHMAFPAQPGERFMDLCAHGETQAIRDLTARKGVPAEPFLDLSQKMLHPYRVQVMDFGGCQLDVGMGWSNPLKATGPIRIKRAVVFPDAGCVWGDCNSPLPGYPKDWFSNLRQYRVESAFYSMDFVASGDLLDGLSRTYPYPGDQAIVSQ